MYSILSIQDTVTVIEVAELMFCILIRIFISFLRERVSTRVRVQNRSKLIQQSKQKWTLSGEEAALHRDNSKMCRNLLNPNSK